MSHETPSSWESWKSLGEPARRLALSEKDFWSKLSEKQQDIFLEEADWQEVRLNPAAKQAWLERLVSLDEVCQHLGATDVQVYFLMSTRKLPGALVGGVWKFNKKEIDRWVEKMGGVEAVRRDAEEQVEKNRAGQRSSG